MNEMGTRLAYRDHHPQVNALAFVAPTAALIGQVEIGAEASIWYGAVLRGDVGQIRVGSRTNVQDNACIHATYQQSEALLGADVIIGHNAVVHGAIVENRALIGMGAVILDNAVVGSGAWVAAGSVVPPRARLRGEFLYRGNPAREARPLKPEELTWATEAVARYVELAREHQRQLHLSSAEE